MESYRKNNNKMKTETDKDRKKINKTKNPRVCFVLANSP